MSDPLKIRVRVDGDLYEFTGTNEICDVFKHANAERLMFSCQMRAAISQALMELALKGHR